MSQRFNLRQAAPEGYKAFGPLYQYIETSGLGRKLVDLVFLRVSQINGCSYCVDLHWRDLMKAGEDQRKINSLMTGRKRPFSARASALPSPGPKASPTSRRPVRRTATMRW